MDPLTVVALAKSVGPNRGTQSNPKAHRSSLIAHQSDLLKKAITPPLTPS
ncbi:hypothetical protein VDG1235_4657 [Verrucomicrobiia bacterium DG1235]|nr:hypothetical protein VDG1235_4657 [Verrucomicrobiae bacterium DG1235]